MGRVDYSSEWRVMFAGGGTAGHVMPGLAVLTALNHRHPRLAACWVGSDRIESTLVPAQGIDFLPIDIRFSYRPLLPRNFGYYVKYILPLLLGRPFRQSLAMIDRWRPQAVIATGGYVAAPVIWAALWRGIPVALIEINNPPGLVNWIFSSRAWRVFAATPAIADEFFTRCSRQKIVTAGYPVVTPQRSKTKVYRDYHIASNRRLLLAMGGSLGAGAIHRSVRELLFAAARHHDPRWERLAVLNVGGERADLIGELAAEQDLPAGPVQYRTTGYLTDAVGAIQAADFYLGRSGASTVGELAAAGLPSLLIPDPQHLDKQQYGNAASLVRRGQGRILEQEEVNGAVLLDWLDHAWDQPHVPPPDPPAADVIADELLKLRGDG